MPGFAAAPLGSVALFAAALIAAELLHRRDDDLGGDDEPDRLSITAPLAAAAALVLGPWPALVTVILGVGTVRRFRGDAWRDTAVRACALGAAALAGGYAYVLAGSSTGSVALPDDLLALTVLGIAFSAVKTLAVRLPAGATDFEPELLAAAAEVALGAGIALAADANLWNAVLLVPVLLLIERLQARLIALRREVASALATFANLVDERDSSTYRHSVRVADSVRELGEALGFPQADVRRLWWAGRLHDLGKVAVDAAALRKRGLLNTKDWEAVHRAPRLSARLLQRFRFTAQQAKAVEYHRERLDGLGYYGARGADLPLAAHFLILADSFDAMTSERPFRPRLTRDEALAEIEANCGTQFHPAIAKAFVAVQRGQRPADVLSAEELASIREASASAPAPRRELRNLLQHSEPLILLGVAGSLAGLGAELFELTVAGAAVALVGLSFWVLGRTRERRLADGLDEALSAPTDRAGLCTALVEPFARAWTLQFAQLVLWEEDGAGGSAELLHGASAVPEAELTSWLLREAESGRDLIVDDGTQLNRAGASVALPLRRENNALVGFLVLGGSGQPPAHVLAAARSRLDRIGLALADAPGPSAPPAELHRLAVS